MRILIVDDNQGVRRGVADIIKSKTSYEVCGEARDGDEAIQKAQELSPEVILLDISMPGRNGLDVARVLRMKHPSTAIFVMSQHDPALLLPRALEAGANGCIDKSRLVTDLVPAIQSVDRSSRAQAQAS